MKAKLYKRTLAFIFDWMIIYFIASIIGIAFNTKSMDDIYNKMDVLGESYLNNEITNEKYYEEYAVLNYDLDREQLLLNVCNTVFIIVFFVIIPFYNNGSSIGKRLFKIKVVDKNGKMPSINKLFFRSVFIDSLGYSLLILPGVLLLNYNSYLNLVIILSLFEVLLVFISVFMVLYRRDKCGIHDLIVGTQVIDI